MRQSQWSKRLVLLLAGALSLLIAAGCQYTATPADLLLSARATPDNAELAAAVRNALPPRAKLTLPDRDANMSAVRKVDIDGDGEPEALVMYMNDNDIRQLMVLKSHGTSWKPWFTFGETSSYGIDWFEVADLEGDGRLELIVGWNEFGDPEHIMNVYRIDPNEAYKEPPKPIAELDYSLARVGDMDGDGLPEVVLIRNDREQMKTSLLVYRMEKGSLRNTITVPLQSGVNGYYNMAIGKIAADRYGIVADAGVGAHSSVTTMLAWEDDRLKIVYPSSKLVPDDVMGSGNIYSTLSEDNNGDGIIEIVMMREAPGQSETSAFSELLWIEQRQQWDGKDSFTIVSEQYVDYSKRYALRFPERWYDRISLRRPGETGNGEITFSLTEAEKTIPLFVIHGIPVKEWSAVEQSWQADGIKYLEVTQSAGLVYAVEWSKPSDSWTDEEKQQHAHMLPSEAELKQLFTVLPEY